MIAAGILESALIAGAVGGIAGFIIGLVMTLFMKKLPCPKCGKTLILKGGNYPPKCPSCKADLSGYDAKA